MTIEYDNNEARKYTDRFSSEEEIREVANSSTFEVLGKDRYGVLKTMIVDGVIRVWVTKKNRMI